MVKESKVVDIHVMEGYYVVERIDGSFDIESDSGEELGFVIPHDAELMSINLSIGYDLLANLENGQSFDGPYYLNPKKEEVENG